MTELRRINRGRNHSYEADGRKLDGVTTIIGDGVPKPALIEWSSRITAETAIDRWDELSAMPPSKRLAVLKRARYEDVDAAARRGTEVHTLAEKLIHGVEVEVPDAIAGHVESCVKFLDDWKLEPVAVEVELFNLTWSIAGTCDVIADVPGKGRFLFDYKTSRSGIFGEIALQLSMYAHAEIALIDGEQVPLPTLGIRDDLAFGVHLRADGYDVFPVPIGDPIWLAARHVIKTARFARTMRDLIGPAVTPDQLEKTA